ncbi:MAG: PHP domain-containing protein [Clostridia bacterium]|nr:PHP domain-containing protein [Clostridia bacterium]
MSCDLHCHSKISDGSMGIDEIIAIARRRGLNTISITDHDAVAGATRAGVIGKRQGVEIVHGVEFSAWDSDRGRRVHILGYMCDAPDRLEGMCRQINANRRVSSTEMVKKVLRYYPIVPDSIVRCASGSTNVFKQHIMHALIDAGYADSFYGDVYHKLFSPEGGCAYVSTTYPDVREIIDLIHSAGGLAVLAHPTVYDSISIMEELTEAGLLDGVEVWHHSADDATVDMLQGFATDHELLMTGGSDFHGMYANKPRPLGSYGAPDGTVQLMKAYKNKRFK